MPEELNNPLHMYEDLIRHGGIDECYSGFDFGCVMLTGEGLSNQETEFTFSERDESGILRPYTERFEEHLNRQLVKAYKSGIQNIDKQLNSTTIESDIRSKLATHLDNLWVLYSEIRNINTYNKEATITTSLIKMISFLRKRYLSLNIFHEAFTLIPSTNQEHTVTLLTSTNEEQTDSLFDFRGQNNQFPELYELLITLDFISDPETTLDSFKTIMRSPKPKEENRKIKLNCQLGKGAYIIQKMSEYFKNLSDLTLIDSKCFVTQQGKQITLSSLHKQRSLYKRNLHSEDERIYIDEKFAELKISKR